MADSIFTGGETSSAAFTSSDTGTPVPVAPGLVENSAPADISDMSKRDIDTHESNFMLAAVSRLFVSIEQAGPGSADIEEVSRAYFEEVSGTGFTKIGWNETACAAFAVALFGDDVLPDMNPENGGSFAQEAFALARVFLMAEKAGGAGAMEALRAVAVAVSRRL